MEKKIVKNEFMQNLQKIREKMPNGYITDIVGDNQSKKQMLLTMFKKSSVDEMTAGEREMLTQFLIYSDKKLREYDTLAKKVATTAKKV